MSKKNKRCVSCGAVLVREYVRGSGGCVPCAEKNLSKLGLVVSIKGVK